MWKLLHMQHATASQKRRYVLLLWVFALLGLTVGGLDAALVWVILFSGGIENVGGYGYAVAAFGTSAGIASGWAAHGISARMALRIHNNVRPRLFESLRALGLAHGIFAVTMYGVWVLAAVLLAFFSGGQLVAQ